MDIFQAVSCGRRRGNERPTWHQGTARLYRPVRRRRRRLTCVAAQRLRHRIHQQQLNSHETVAGNHIVASIYEETFQRVLM